MSRSERDMRSVIVESMQTHHMRQGWAYGGTSLKHDEAFDYGIVCMCGWARMSDERDVCGPAARAHEADEIAAALVRAGYLTDEVLDPRERVTP